jgi:hypothetical protein
MAKRKDDNNAHYMVFKARKLRTDLGLRMHHLRTAQFRLGWLVRSAHSRHVLRKSKSEVQSLTIYKR